MLEKVFQLSNSIKAPSNQFLYRGSMISRNPSKMYFTHPIRLETPKLNYSLVNQFNYSGDIDA